MNLDITHSIIVIQYINHVNILISCNCLSTVSWSNCHYVLQL